MRFLEALYALPHEPPHEHAGQVTSTSSRMLQDAPGILSRNVSLPEVKAAAF